MSSEIQDLEIQKAATEKYLAGEVQKPQAAFQIYEIKRFFMLVYRHGLNSNLIKIFYHQGSLAEARIRASQHCEIMKYKLLYVKPLISDLDSEERIHLGRD